MQRITLPQLFVNNKELFKIEKSTVSKYWSKMNELTCFNWKYSNKSRKLSKNDKFVTNKAKICFICFNEHELKTKLSGDGFYFSCFPFRNPPEWEQKSTEKDEKVTYRQHTTKLFSVLKLSRFSVINTFEESL